MADSYCDAAEIKQSMSDTDWGEDYDSLLDTLAKRASRAIDNACKWWPGAFKVSSDSTIYYKGNNTISLSVELAQAPTKVEVSEDGNLLVYTLWASTDYITIPYNATLLGEPIRRLDIDNIYGTKLVWPEYQKSIKITGRYGYSVTPPDDIVEAVIIQASRWFKRGQQGWQDTGAIRELGQLQFTKKLDPDVEETVENYMRVPL